MATGDTPIKVRMNEALLPPEQAQVIFSEVAKLPTEALTKIIKWLETGRLTLSVEDNAELFKNEVKGLSALEFDAAEMVMNYFRLESLRRILEWKGDEFVKYFVEEDKSSGVDESRASLLGKLFQPSEQVELLYKAQRIYEGSVPSYSKAATTVDFRPVFADNLDINNGLITTILEIVVRKPDETTEMQRIAIQVDFQDICELERVLSRAKDKIGHLKETLKKQCVALLNPAASIERRDKQ